MPDENLLVDGQIDFSRGQDASGEPDLVSPSGYFSGVNVSTQKGCLSPRWSWKHRELKLPSGGVKLPTLQTRLYTTIFETGKFQAMIPYSIGTEYFVIVIISGIIFLVNQDTFEVDIIGIADSSQLDQGVMRVNWSRAGRFLTIFDFPARPVIMENGIARRSDAVKYEVPISRLGVSNQNRLFIANAGDEFTAGDPEGSLLTPNAPITFEEVLIPSAPYVNQFFRVSTNYSNDIITAMGFLQQVDKSTDIGPLFVSTQNAIWTYPTNNPRSTWTSGAFGTVFVSNGGVAGQRSFVNVGSDIFFLSGDGQLRSASVSRDEQGKWSKVPISKEVENWLKYYELDSARYSVLGYFNNNIFITANPFNCVAKTQEGNSILDIAFGGFVVLNTANVATLISKKPNSDRTPAWDGLWTGVRPMEICNNNGRCFVMSKDFGAVNRFYELDQKDTVDIISKKERYIESIVYTKEYDCKDQFFDKELQTLEFTLNNLKGDFEMDVRFKPSQSPYFFPWNKFTYSAPYRVCKPFKDCQFQGLVSQAFKEITLGMGEGVCDPVTQTDYTYFRKVQFKIKLKGKAWKLRAFKVNAQAREKPLYDVECSEYPTTSFCRECDTDWSIPNIELCHPATT